MQGETETVYIYIHHFSLAGRSMEYFVQIDCFRKIKGLPLSCKIFVTTFETDATIDYVNIVCFKNSQFMHKESKHECEGIIHHYRCHKVEKRLSQWPTRTTRQSAHRPGVMKSMKLKC